MNIIQAMTWLLSSNKSRYLVLFTICVTLFCALGLKDMDLASDYKIFFDENYTGLQVLEQIEQRYTATDNVFIMITPKTGDIYNPETLSLVFDLVEKLWTLPYVSRVDGLTNFPYSQAVEDDITIEEFVYEKDQLTVEHITYIKQAAQGERDLLGSLITHDGKYTGINVTTLMPGDNHKGEILAVNAALEQVLENVRAEHSDHQFYATGIVTMNGAFFKAAMCHASMA